MTESDESDGKDTAITKDSKYKVARVFSDVGNAITYSLVVVFLFSIAHHQDHYPGWFIFLMAFLFTVLAPGLVLGLAIKLRPDIDFDFTERKSRLPFYLVTEAAYIGGIFLFSPLIFPSWPMFCLAVVSTLLTGSLTIINEKWKISAHAAGAVGPTTGIAVVFGPWTLLITAPIAMGIIWSRLHLKKHTAAQLLFGSLLAISCYLVVFLGLYPLSLF